MIGNGFAFGGPPVAVTVEGGAPAVMDQAQSELNRVKLMIQFGGMNGVSQIGQFQVSRSQRNPTALFGAGLIDTIPDAVLEAAAKAKHPGFPEIQGRVSQLKGGKIGRFGWKAQTVSLEDFVLTACAVELGLEVPDHHQGGLPQSPDVKAKGLDLNADECAALVAFVKSLPQPIEAAPGPGQAGRDIAAGKELFTKIGCASCHTPKLGDVAGIYSDLLLHDMGPELGDVGQYGVFTREPSEPEFVDPEGPLAEAAPAVPGAVTTAPVPPGEAVPFPSEFPVAPVPAEAPAVPQVVSGTVADMPAFPNTFVRRSSQRPTARPSGPPAPRASKSGGHPRSGACATRGLICMTAAPRRSNKRSPCTVARASRPPTSATSCSRPKSAPSSRRFSARSSPQRYNWPARGNEGGGSQ